ncbi:ABC transporter substrate-binding protein [Paenibacillus mesophilus]|uniref:ABC transporter substrate-binding protein n=1 Tax=Paenibacillus mesophilus TaxID=2582849 RepID=UPI0013050831|nr:extracellular solute-binding protein [Paenibacillus mesophilus]
MNKAVGLSVVSIIVWGLAGCGGKEPAVEKAALAPKPVTIKIASQTETAYNMIADTVRKKYPHITLEQMKYQNNNFSEMLTRGDKPDLIEVGQGGLSAMQTAGLDYDHRLLIKESDFDFSRFKEGLLDYPANFSQDRNKLAAMFIVPNYYALYYNKDIFNRFGVSYPKDGMTWNEVIDLAKRVTATDRGILYSGLQFPNLWDPKSQLDQHYIDPVSGKAVLHTAGWRTVFETLGRTYLIPGNAKDSNPAKMFTQNTLAMIPEGDKVATYAGIADLNWDMASYPVFESRRGYGPSLAGYLLAVTSISEHKREAFQVAMVAFSDEVQQKMAMDGKATAIKGFDHLFGKNIPGIESKNVQAISKNQFGKPHGAVIYKEVPTLMDKAFSDYTNGMKDVNTALREVEDEANQVINKSPK